MSCVTPGEESSGDPEGPATEEPSARFQPQPHDSRGWRSALIPGRRYGHPAARLLNGQTTRQAPHTPPRSGKLSVYAEQAAASTVDLRSFGIGRWAVDIFFIVSGFLVTRSVMTQPTLIETPIKPFIQSRKEPWPHQQPGCILHLLCLIT